MATGMDQAPAGGDRTAWKPNPGPQTVAITCPIPDLGFGGARGGGKSQYLLGDFSIGAEQYGPNLTGLLFRRTYDELDDLKKKAGKLLPQLGCIWKEDPKTWYYPQGAELKFRYLERDADAERYQGHEYQWIGGDDAGSFPNPDPIDKLYGCLRSTAGVPCKFRLTFNPGGRGHQWLKQRYILPSKPYQPFDGPDGTRRVFIPSYLKDNPYLDPIEYVKQLRKVGAPWLVKAWIEGDWSGPPQGGLLDPDLMNLFDEDPRWLHKKMGLHAVCYWDFAVTEKDLENNDDPDYTACLVVARDGPRLYILDAWRKQCAPDETINQIIIMQRKWGARVKGEAGIIEKVMQPQLRSRCKELGYQVVLEPWKKGGIDKVQHSIGFQIILGAGNVYAPRNALWLADYQHELSTFPTQGAGIHDDWVDDSSAAAADMQGQQDAAPDPQTPGLRVFSPEASYDQLQRFQKQAARERGEDPDDDGRESFW